MAVLVSGQVLDLYETEQRRRTHAELLRALDAYILPQLRSLEPGVLASRMVDWHARGAGYGIAPGRAMDRLLALHLTVLPDFDLAPQVSAFLKLEAMTGEQKLQALYTRLRAR